MKLLSPLSNVEDYESLVEAGADEFYCGYMPYRWLSKRGVQGSLNRREYVGMANTCTLSSMKILRRKIEDFHIPVKITLNSITYDPMDYPLILNIVQELLDIGFDTFIIADLGLLFYLKEQGVRCNCHISGEFPVLNSETIDFLTAFDIQRIIFPRKMSIVDITSCIQKFRDKVPEYEAFVLNESCLYIGAFCNTLHCDELVSFCFAPTRINKMHLDHKEFKQEYRFLSLSNLYDNQILSGGHEKGEAYSFAEHGCGVCFVKELEAAGITSLKIVGRGRSREFLLNDIQNMKAILALADTFDDHQRTAFQQQVKERFFHGRCLKSTHLCYYPQN